MKGMIGTIKISAGIAALLALSLFSLYYILPALAAVGPGATPFGQGLQVNITNTTDIFFTSGNVVSLVANFTCSPNADCTNATGRSAYGNFSGINSTSGSNQVAGELLANNTTYALYRFSATVGNTFSITNFRAANITANFTANDSTSVTVWNVVVLVNMSTIPGCPPEGENIQLPPAVPLMNGTVVNTAYCFTNCTVNDRAQIYNSTHYNLCGPTFGPDTTNFTRVAESGNFSNVPLVIDFPGKAKINFTGGVNMSTQQQAQAIMQFAMENLMTGGRVGINDTEWNGTYNPNKPNMNLSARLTLYNISGILGITTGSPQIIRTAFGASLSAGSTCPAGYCTGISWDGQDLTFTVGGFSDFGASNDINVTLVSPANFSYVNTRNVNFTYTPVWATSTMKNCTVYGNFTDGWLANASNTSTLVSNVTNRINNTVNADAPYKWNIYCFDTGTGYDYDSANWTVTVDTVKPTYVGNATKLANGTQYNPGANYGFQIDWTDTNGISNTTFQLGRPTGALTNYTDGTPAIQKSGSTYYINFTQDQLGQVGTYNYTWFANDSADNWNSSSTVLYIVNQNTSLRSRLFLNGTEGDRTYNVGDAYNFTTTLNISKTIKIDSNLTGWAVQSGTGTSLTNESTLTMTPGKYNVTGYFEGDTNYTSTSQTYWVSVFGWANATAYKNVTIDYAKSGTPVNIGCLVRNANTSATLVGYYVEIYNGTTNFSAGRTDSNGLYNATLTMSADASQNIKCAIYDNTTSYYNISANSTSTLSSDFTNPSISITSPTATSYGSSSISFAYTASDTGSGISTCSYTVDSGSATSSGASVSTTITNLGDGGHKISVTCTDAAGNSGSASVTFTVSTGGVSPPSSSTGPSGTTNIIIPSIAAGATKSITITKGVHGVSKVTITVKNSVAAVYIDVGKIPGKPATVVHEVVGKVYHYIEINKTNIKDEDINKTKIKFAVSKSWINANNISVDTVALNRYTTKWDKLPTSKVNETADEIEYEAESPGLSYFAISGEVKTAPEVPEEKPKEELPPEEKPAAPVISPVIYVAVAIILIAILYFAKARKKKK